MREILFRGKRIDNGEWVKGGCYASRGGKRYIITYSVVIHEYPGDAPDIYDDFSVIEVDPSTFSEFTGLTDKNGKKIFEGDIVRIPNNSIDNYSIDIVCDIGMVVIHNHRDMGLDTDFSIWYGCELEVIGNIHDNPELLETGV